MAKQPSYEERVLAAVRARTQKTVRNEVFEAADEIVGRMRSQLISKAEKSLKDEIEFMFVNELKKQLPGMIQRFVKEVFLTT